MKRKKQTEEIEQKIPVYTMLQGRYLIGAVMAQSSFSRIYRAYDSVLDIDVAVKEFISFSEEDKEEFLYEAGLFFGSNEHPGLTAVRDVFQENGQAFLVMEYLSGDNLKEYLQKKHENRMEEGDFMRLLEPVAETLSYLHSMGIVHCAVTPDKLIFDKEGRLHLTGIGCCRQRMKRGNPEKRGEEAGPWTDVLGMSCVLKESILYKRMSDELHQTVRDGTSDRIFRRPFCMEGLFKYSDKVAVYTGAVKKEWGEKWLEITADPDIQDEWKGKRAFLTRKQKRFLIATVFAVVIAGFGIWQGLLYYAEKEPEKVLAYQIKQDRKKQESFDQHPLSRADEEYDWIWDYAQKNGRKVEYENGVQYRLTKDQMKDKKIVGNYIKPFAVTADHLKKLIELKLNIRLRKTNESVTQASVFQNNGELKIIEVEASEENTYEYGEKDQLIKITIQSDMVTGMVLQLNVDAQPEVISTVLDEVFPIIVPEAYFTEEEIRGLLEQLDKECKADEYGYGSVYVRNHGKYELLMHKDEGMLQYGDDDSDNRIDMELKSYRVTADYAGKEEDFQRAGNYARGSEKYNEFMKFVKERAVSVKEEDGAVVYSLTEKDAKDWGEPSNCHLLTTTWQELVDHLKNKNYKMQELKKKNGIKVWDYGYGAIETYFYKNIDFQMDEQTNIKIIYDCLTDRIGLLEVYNTMGQPEQAAAAALDVISFLSLDSGPVTNEDIRSKQEQISEYEAEGDGFYSGGNMEDLSYMILKSDAMGIFVAIKRHGYPDGLFVDSFSPYYWP